MILVGDFYENGMGCEKNLLKAFEYRQKAVIWEKIMVTFCLFFYNKKILII